MITRIEIAATVFDTRADVMLKKLKKSGYKIASVTVNDIYTIDKELSRSSVRKILDMLTHPVVQIASLTKPLAPPKFNWAIEIGFLPGVTDNIATTTKEMSEDLLRIKFAMEEGIYTSQVFYLSGEISKTQIKEISDSLYNPVIQRATIINYTAFRQERGLKKLVPKVKLESRAKVDIVNLEIPDEELIALGKQGIPNADGTRRGPLALDLLFMQTIRDYFRKLKRSPTDIELESIAQTWSEHCKHTIFADPIDGLKEGLFKTYIKKATDEIRKKKKGRDNCVSVFTDNSGAIEFDDHYLITHKVETHNSPSALDPFGGAITGIVGVNRDAIGFGMGAKPIVNTYGFCFADPNDDRPLYKGANFSQKMLSPRRIMDGVIAGVNSGGNCSGIPSPQGFVYFDTRFKGKPLVFVGTVGLIPKKISNRHAELVSASPDYSKKILKRVQDDKLLYVKKARPGDYIVMVGGRVGLDGIHGATFSSEAMDSGSPATAVQIGDPITQKKLSDALVKEARDLGLYTSITDNGAGGLSCSVAEMAKESGGCLVHLEKVPVKYAGIAPWQIWVSESQERMTLAVPKNKWKQLSKLLNCRGVEATIIGTFTVSRTCIVTYKNKKIMDVDMHFLHYGLPIRPMQTKKLLEKFNQPKLPRVMNLSKFLLKMLGRQSIASFEFISMQFDHEVQANSVLKPLQGRGRINSETSAVRPLLTSTKAVILSQALYPSYSEVDPYQMAAVTIDHAIRNVIGTGADPDTVALLDNFCWCSSTDPVRLWQLKQAAKACYDTALAFRTPFISGKDSMFNDFKGYDGQGNPVKISIPPTLLISAIGTTGDATQLVSLDTKFPGDLIYVLGSTFDELGASEYFRLLSDEQKKLAPGGTIPKVTAVKNKQLYNLLHKAIKKDLLASAISIGRGGIGVALAKMAIGGQLGIEINFKKLPGKVTRDDFALFSESSGRLVVTVTPKNKNKFETIMKSTNFAMVGTVTAKNQIEITNHRGDKVVDLSLAEVETAYKRTFKDM